MRKIVLYVLVGFVVISGLAAVAIAYVIIDTPVYESARHLHADLFLFTMCCLAGMIGLAVMGEDKNGR